MVNFLNRGLEGQDRISRRLNRDEAQTHLIDQLRIPAQQRLVASMDQFFNTEGESLPEPRLRRIRELLGQFRVVQGNTLRRSRVGLLLEIIALATGESLSAEETELGADDLSLNLEKNIHNHPEMWSSVLQEHSESLVALEDLAPVMPLEEVEENLREYSVDRILVFP